MIKILSSEWENSASRYFMLMNIATLIALAFLVELRLDTGFGPFAGLLLVAMLIWLALTKPADEFARVCWNSGAQLAFFATLLCTVLLAFFAGLLEGLGALATGIYPAYQAAINDAVGHIAITAFFIGFHWRRLRGLG